MTFLSAKQDSFILSNKYNTFVSGKNELKFKKSEIVKPQKNEGRNLKDI